MKRNQMMNLFISQQLKKIFDFDDHLKKMKKFSEDEFILQRRKIQLEKLAELIENEKKIKIEFTNDIHNFQITKFVYSQNNFPIDLFKFFDKYNQYEIKCNLLNENENQSENESEENEENEMKETSTFISQSINKILSEENELSKTKYVQRNTIIRKINNSLINYLLHECENYKICFSNKRNFKRGFLFISQIFKNNELIVNFDIINDQIEDKTSSIINATKRLNQIEWLSEIYENETGNHLHFKEISKNVLEIVSFEDKNFNELDLYEFITKYNKYIEMNQDDNQIQNNEEEQIQYENENNEMQEENYQIQHYSEEQIQNNYNNPVETVDLSFLSSFNSTLITLLNKLHYVITFLKPDSDSIYRNDIFLIIKTIQKESDKSIVYNSSDEINQNKSSQIKEMMNIIENETHILFLFESEEIIQPKQDLGIKINDQLISVGDFILKYNNSEIIHHIITCFSIFEGDETYQMNKFMKTKENEFKIKIKTNIWKSIKERIQDEWKRIMIYLLTTIKYSITFTKETIASYQKYLTLLQQIEMNENDKKEMKIKWKELYMNILKYKNELNLSSLSLSFQENTIDFDEEISKELTIESIQKENQNRILTIKDEQKQMKEMITIINKDSDYEVIYQEINSKIIPQYIKLKHNENEKIYCNFKGNSL